jgi:hypothetical protein
MIDPETLIEVANKMMDEADARVLGLKAAVLFRNGAIIMGATLCPLRRDAWGRIRIGQHLHLESDHARLTFEAGELKATKRSFEAKLPWDYAARLNRYIIRYRSLLLPGARPDALKGSPKNM